MPSIQLPPPLETLSRCRCWLFSIHTWCNPRMNASGLTFPAFCSSNSWKYFMNSMTTFNPFSPPPRLSIASWSNPSFTLTFLSKPRKLLFTVCSADVAESGFMSSCFRSREAFSTGFPNLLGSPIVPESIPGTLKWNGCSVVAEPDPILSQWAPFASLSSLEASRVFMSSDRGDRGEERGDECLSTLFSPTHHTPAEI